LNAFSFFENHLGKEDVNHMSQNPDDDMIPAQKLDLVKDSSPWLKPASAFLAGDPHVTCPLCGAPHVQVTAACGKDLIGFLALHCPTCGKSVHFSRVRFPASLSIPKL
jgi:hypothetical protein